MLFFIMCAQIVVPTNTAGGFSLESLMIDFLVADFIALCSLHTPLLFSF